MSGFIRRFGYYPGTEVLTQIEGVNIIDLSPPGSIQGVDTGVVAAVGEFSDMTYATVADTSGNISTKIQPVEIFSGADLVNKVGGFDETLGEFGVSGGNGFVALRNKRFSRLIAVPVNMASAKGARFFRYLPMCRSQTDANPIVPVIGGTIDAGREFRNGSGRMRIAARIQFTAQDTIEIGTGGNSSSGASAATQVFNRPSGDWSTIERADGSVGARKGDILVVGYNSAGTASPAGVAGTYRVQTDAPSGTALTVERLDGASFAWTAEANVPWRLHLANDADSAPERVPGSADPGGYATADTGGYVVPVRPLTNSAGVSASDGTWPAGTLLTPAVVPDALTGSTWDPLSGLGGITIPGSTTAYTAAVQKANAVAASAIDALYTTAIDAMLADSEPAREANLIGAARKSSTIRNKIKSHVLTSSSQGRGRTGVISPELTVVTAAAVGVDSDPGVGANRAERIVYAWPGEQTYVPEAVGYRLKTADGSTTLDGILDVTADFRALSLLSNLPPERNPGQAADPVPEIMASVLGIQRGLEDLGINEYTYLRQKGIMALRLDRTAGPIFQSGITTSLTSGQKNINRRRMADFIQDSIAERLVQFSKLPLTNQLKDGAEGEVTSFLNTLLSPNNPAAQRINAYQVDRYSGNTPDLEAQGIFVLIVRVRTTPTADFLVLQTEIGDSVVIQEAA